MEIMPRKSIGETAMTDAERQARYRAARAAGKPVVRVRRALDHRGRGPGVGQIMSPALWKHRSSTLPGWTACRTVFRTVRPPKHCGRSAISISLSCRRSNHRAASAGTDKPFTDIAHNGLHRWVHRNPPRAAASASRWALRVARVPPMDYRHKPPRRGVNFGRRSGVNIQRRLTVNIADVPRLSVARLFDQRGF